MVVVCPECGAKFSLDESRIAGAVAKVRCSRCRHVFQITRQGQVVSPEWQPPAEISRQSPLPQEGRETFAVPEMAEPPTAPEGEPVSEEAAAIPPEGTSPGAWAPFQKLRLWVVLPVLFLVIVVGLGWWFFQGKSSPGPLKPLTGAIQRLQAKLRGQGEPAPAASGRQADPSAPAPTVVTPPPPPIPAPDLRDVPVDWAQASYQGLVNDKAGQLLVIQGEVINAGKDPRGPVRLKATLTDSRHQPLREEIVYAGTTLTDSELKTLDPNEIKGWLLKPGGRSQERVLKPGHKQPFTIVFFGVSGNLAETQCGFQVVVVEGPVAAAHP